MKKCAECEEFFNCRFCHDDAKYLNESDVKKAHQINRFNVQEIKCLKCDHVQKVKTNNK
jgi:RING finger/CHY zinc finger protein 1